MNAEESPPTERQSVSPMGARRPGSVRDGRERWRVLFGWGGVVLLLWCVPAIWLQMGGPGDGSRPVAGTWSWWNAPIARRNDFPPADGSDPNVYGVSFSNRTDGWICTGGGQVYHTTDAGVTWASQNAGLAAPNTYSRIRFTDPQHGVVIGQRGRVAVTFDGGATWNVSTAALPPEYVKTLLDPEFAQMEAGLFAVDFADARRGWAAGVNRIVATDDGGRTWREELLSGERAPQRADTKNPKQSQQRQQQQQQQTRTPSEGTVFWCVDALPNGEVWAGASDGVLWRKTTGGWQAKSVPVNGEIHAIQFVDALYGWAASSGVLLATTDGGEVWTVRPGPHAGTPVMYFADRKQGWIAADDGIIFATSDGGATWARWEGQRNVLHALQFTDARHGWAVGVNGTILSTTNGGATWRDQRPAFPRFPSPLCMVAAAAGMIGLLVAAIKKPPQPSAPVRSIDDIFVSDTPLRHAADAPEWMRRMTEALANYLGNPRTAAPVTLAITGPWGRGKSSVMELLRGELENNGHRPVVFNAWHHQDSGNVLAALIGAVREQAIPAPIEFPERPPFITLSGSFYYLRLAAQRARRMWLQMLVLTGLLSLSITWLTINWSRLGELEMPKGGGDWLEVLASLIAVLAGVGPVAKLLQLLRAFGVDPAKLAASGGEGKARDQAERNVFRTRFATEFAEVTSALGPECRMVIFIDDLDRCAPAHLLQVLEATNFLNSCGQCFIVLGMQRESVLSALKQALNIAQLGPDGDPERWLEKLVQIEVGVPRDDHALRRLLPDSGTAASPPAGHRGWRYFVLLPLGALALWAVASLGMSGGRSAKLAIKKPEPAAPLAVQVDIPAAFNGGETTDPDWRLTGTYEPGKTLALKVAGLPRKTPEEKSDSAPVTQSQRVPLALPSGKAPAGAVPAGVLEAEDIPPGARLMQWIAVLGAATAAVLLIVALNRRFRRVTADSGDFVDAVLAWQPLLSKKCETPRELKRMLNRMRFDAMLVRALAKPDKNGSDQLHAREAEIVTLAALERYWPEVFDLWPRWRVSDPRPAHLPDKLREGLTSEAVTDLEQRIVRAVELYAGGALEAFRQFKESIRLGRSIGPEQQAPESTPSPERFRIETSSAAPPRRA